MSRKLLFAIITLVAFATPSCSSLAVAAATVNDTKITENEVESELDVLRGDPVFGQALRTDPDTRGQRRREILNELIYQSVAEQQARRLKIKVNDAQADRLIEQAARTNGASVEQFLESQNLTREQARRIAGRGVLRFALIDKVVRDVDVDDEAVAGVYEGQEDRFVDVHLERITVATDKDARDVVEDIGSGSTFAEVARDRSKDALAKGGGDLGFVPLTGLDPSVQGPISQAVEGGLTDPIQGSSGFEIYHLVERRTKSFDEVEADIRGALAAEEKDVRYQRWLSEKVRDAKIVVNPKYGRLDRSAENPAVVASTGELAP